MSTLKVPQIPGGKFGGELRQTLWVAADGGKVRIIAMAGQTLLSQVSRTNLNTDKRKGVIITPEGEADLTWAISIVKIWG